MARTPAKISADIELSNARLAKANAQILRSCAAALGIEIMKDNPDKGNLSCIVSVLNDEADNFNRDAAEHAQRRRDFLRIDKRQRK